MPGPMDTLRSSATLSRVRMIAIWRAVGKADWPVAGAVGVICAAGAAGAAAVEPKSNPPWFGSLVVRRECNTVRISPICSKGMPVSCMNSVVSPSTSRISRPMRATGIAPTRRCAASASHAAQR